MVYTQGMTTQIFIFGTTISPMRVFEYARFQVPLFRTKSIKEAGVRSGATWFSMANGPEKSVTVFPKVKDLTLPEETSVAYPLRVDLTMRTFEDEFDLTVGISSLISALSGGRVLVKDFAVRADPVPLKEYISTWAGGFESGRALVNALELDA